MQEHLERFPTHKLNTAIKQVDSELQDIFQTLHETPINSNLYLILMFYKNVNVIVFQLI